MKFLSKIYFSHLFFTKYNIHFSFFYRYDSSIRPIKVPIATSDMVDNSKDDQWKAYIFTCESKFSAVMPFGISIDIQGNINTMK